MKKQDWSWRLLAIILSVTLHVALAFEFRDKILSASDKAPELPKLTQVRINFTTPQPVIEETPPEPELPPEPTPEPPPEPEPEPIVKKEPPPKPKPVPKPKPKPKPEPKPKPKPKPVQKPAPPPPKPVVEEVVATPAVITPAPIPVEELRQQYLAEILSRIEKAKFYPKVARRKGIQGKIHVRFTLTCAGAAENIEITQGHKLLKKGALNAVEKAQPLPTPPQGVDCPMPVQYAMAFELK